jgi:hypothetical protein
VERNPVRSLVLVALAHAQSWLWCGKEDI